MIRRKAPRPKAIWTEAFPPKHVVTEKTKRPVKFWRSKKPRTRIKPATSKRLAQLREYSKARIAWLAGRKCERHSVYLREALATEVHHKLGRRGPSLLDQSKWVALCSECHAVITNEPKKAIEEGWTDPSGWRGGK